MDVSAVGDMRTCGAGRTNGIDCGHARVRSSTVRTRTWTSQNAKLNGPPVICTLTYLPTIPGQLTFTPAIGAKTLLAQTALPVPPFVELLPTYRTRELLCTVPK